jgi:peptide-methionine (S)-S-oxide reductase
MPRSLKRTLPVIIACCALLALWTVRTLGAGEAPVPPKALRDLPPGKPGELRTVVVAGGCFWCEEAVFEQLKGVTAVVAGYAGGTAATATYEQYEESNHAEAVKITYDSSLISYGDLLRVLFAAGEPTVKDGQKPDYGHQYRMAVFYQNEAEKQAAEAYISQLTEAKVYDQPIQATVETMPEGFFPAEGYHQHFVSKNPDHPYVCQWSLRKIARIRAAFPDQVKTAELAPPNK